MKHIKSKSCLEPICEKRNADGRHHTSSLTLHFFANTRTAGARSEFEGQKLQIKAEEFGSHRRMKMNFLQQRQILACFRFTVHISENKNSIVSHCSPRRQCLMFASLLAESENDRKDVDIVCHMYRSRSSPSERCFILREKRQNSKLHIK